MIPSYHHIITSPHHHLIISSYQHTSISSHHHIITSSYHHNTASSYHHIIISSCHHIIISSYHHVISHHITSYPIMSYHITSHHITSIDARQERAGGRDGRRRTGCIQNENPHIGEWWEKQILKIESMGRHGLLYVYILALLGLNLNPLDILFLFE